MKMFQHVALATVALATMAGAAHADLNINGAVGLPLNPTAQIPAEGGARIQANYYDFGNDAETYGLFAAARVGNNFEVNGGINKLSTNGGPLDRTGFAIGAKYLITRESDPAGVRFAVGAGYDRALLKNTNVYAVASKSLGQISEDRTPITGHLGLRYDNFDAFGGNSDKVSIFAGVEVPVTKTGDIQFVGEVGTKIADGGDTPYSAGIRYRPAGRPFGASLGIAQYGLTDKARLYAQIGYTFNTK